MESKNRVLCSRYLIKFRMFRFYVICTPCDSVVDNTVSCYGGQWEIFNGIGCSCPPDTARLNWDRILSAILQLCFGWNAVSVLHPMVYNLMVHLYEETCHYLNSKNP